MGKVASKFKSVIWWQSWNWKCHFLHIFHFSSATRWHFSALPPLFELVSGPCWSWLPWRARIWSWLPQRSTHKCFSIVCLLGIHGSWHLWAWDAHLPTPTNNYSRICDIRGSWHLSQCGEVCIPCQLPRMPSGDITFRTSVGVGSWEPESNGCGLS